LAHTNPASSRATAVTEGIFPPGQLGVGGVQPLLSLPPAGQRLGRLPGLLAVGSADKTVRLWNVSDHAHPALVGAPLTGPTGYVWDVAFSPDGTTLVAGVTDGTILRWDLADPAHPALTGTLTGPAGHVYSIAYSRSGQVLAAARDDGTVHLWDTSPAAAMAAVYVGAGQQLARQEWATYVPGFTYRVPC
jgi:WD domain, G-beta repeat